MEKYEVWKWSAYTGDYSVFINYCDTQSEAERLAEEHGECIIIPPQKKKHRILYLNNALIIAVPIAMWIGGKGYVDYYSLFRPTFFGREHIGFVRRSEVKGDEIPADKVCFT
jgi:hypothetical protein